MPSAFVGEILPKGEASTSAPCIHGFTPTSAHVSGTGTARGAALTLVKSWSP